MSMSSEWYGDFDEKMGDLTAKIKAAEDAGRELRKISFSIDQRLRSVSEYVEYDLCVCQESEIKKIGRQACEVANCNCDESTFDQEQLNQIVADFVGNIEWSRKRLNDLLAHYDHLEYAARCYQRVTEARLEAKKVLRHC